MEREEERGTPVTQQPGGPPYLDAQALTDLEASVYEAVATLEYSGWPVTVAQVAGVTGLDDGTAGTILDAFVAHGVLIPVGADAGGGDELGLARRDWSAAPETRSR
jgi:hypothetical protein